MLGKKEFVVMLEKKNLHKPSPEILAVATFAKGLYKQKQMEQMLQFMICTDFLIKGKLLHWQIKLKESVALKGTDLMKSFETKFPLLIGDQYHSMAYFMVTRIGNVELSRLLAVIEENFQKISYNTLEKWPAEFEANLAFIYEHFYNYLPQLIGNTYKGLGVIYGFT